MKKATSPVEFFGFKPGNDRNIIRWDRLCEYFDLLAVESNYVNISELGKTTRGNRFMQVVITSPENMMRLDNIKFDCRRLALEPELRSEEILEITKNGVCVCVQSMSIHSKELGGTQMSPLLAYELITGSYKEVLQNVVLVMIPCANPDGQIMVTDFYNEYLDTEYEGCTYPDLYHDYAGHDTNRDSVFGNLLESKYIIDILFKRWNPQVFVDHHQMGSYEARMFVPPYADSVIPYGSPILMREQAWYGTDMAYDLETAGVKGVVSNMFSNTSCHTFHSITCMHNIVGLLTESAHAKMASPRLIYRDQLKQRNDFSPCRIQNFHPSPWQGGYWHLGDIVNQQLITALSVLKTMSKNRSRVLRSTAQKAREQVDAGKQNGFDVFLIPPARHDKSARRRLLDILSIHNVEMYITSHDFISDQVVFPQGTVAVPLAQPKYCLIMNLLSNPDFAELCDRKKDPCADMMTGMAVSLIGVDVKAANVHDHTKMKLLVSLPETDEECLAISETDSFLKVNRLLKRNLPVFRNEKGFSTVCGDTVKFVQAAIYQRHYSGNPDEGWIRFILDRFSFPYKTIYDPDILNHLSDYEVLILPSDQRDELDGRPEVFEPEWLGNQPPKYCSGLGEEGKAAMRKFVRDGGTLLVFNNSCDYIIDAFDLKIKNIVAELPKDTFCSHGSILKIIPDRSNHLCWGAGGEINVVSWNSPVFSITETFTAGKYRPAAYYAETGILKNGYLIGKEFIEGKPAVVNVEYGKGCIVLYSFSPTFRAQTYSAFRLLFNALYK